MHFIVCIKQVLDPEMPVSSFRIDEEHMRVIPAQGIPPVISTFDENALEAALQLKEIHGGKVTAISLGYKLSRPIIKKSLSAGADDLLILDDPAFENMDSFATARVLARAITRLGDYDLILTGRQAADWDAGITGQALSEELDVPCITVARQIQLEDGLAIVERMVEDGYEIVESMLPCVITVSNDFGKLRPITIPGITQAKKKPVKELNATELGLNPVPASRCKLERLYVPSRMRTCKIIEEETPEKAGEALAERLHDQGII